MNQLPVALPLARASCRGRVFPGVRASRECGECGSQRAEGLAQWGRGLGREVGAPRVTSWWGWGGGECMPRKPLGRGAAQAGSAWPGAGRPSRLLLVLCSCLQFPELGRGAAVPLPSGLAVSCYLAPELGPSDSAARSNVRLVLSAC